MANESGQDEVIEQSSGEVLVDLGEMLASPAPEAEAKSLSDILGAVSGGSEESASREEQLAEVGVESTTEVPGHDSEYLYRASMLGISAEDAKQDFTPEGLKRFVWREEQRRFQAPPMQPAGAPVQPQTPPQIPKFKLPEKMDDWDPEIKDAISGMNDYYSEQNARLAIALLQMHQSGQQSQEARIQEDFDLAIRGLGPEYAEILGDKPGYELDLTSPLASNRRAIYGQFRRMLDSGVLSGGDVRQTVRNLVNAQFHKELTEFAVKKAREESQGELARRRNGSMITAGGKSEKEQKSGKSAALERIEQFRRNAG